MTGETPQNGGPLEPLLIDRAGVARLLQVSVRHIDKMESTGRIGPKPIKLGRVRRYRADEVSEWVRQGCPGRSEFLARQNGH